MCTAQLQDTGPGRGTGASLQWSIPQGAMGLSPAFDVLSVRVRQCQSDVPPKSGPENGEKSGKNGNGEKSGNNGENYIYRVMSWLFP
jgi:hypothetical protein